MTTAVGTITVHLGPAGFLRTFDMTIEEGDEVVVVGSRVSMAGRSVILAKEITVAGDCLLLRLTDGTPRWFTLGQRS